MSRTNDGELFVHVQLELTVSENSNYWYDPRASKNISFDIPLDMFNADSLAKKVTKIVKELETAYPQAKIDHEEKEAKEAAEKAAKEAEKVTA
jgi:hypothetical protein